MTPRRSTRIGWARRKRTRGDFTTCMATCGSGAAITTRKSFPAERTPWWKPARTGCAAAGAGVAPPGAAGQRVGAGRPVVPERRLGLPCRPSPRGQVGQKSQVAGRDPLTVWSFADAIQVLFPADVDPPLADRWRGVTVFAQFVLGDHAEFWARSDDGGHASIGKKVDPSGRLDRRGAKVWADPLFPIALPRLGLKAACHAAAGDDQQDLSPPAENRRGHVCAAWVVCQTTWVLVSRSSAGSSAPAGRAARLAPRGCGRWPGPGRAADGLPSLRGN